MRVHTRIIDIDDRSPQESAVEEVSAILKAGGVVAVPTETVYGLAADALNPAAVRRIFEAKGRPADNPLIVHIASEAMLPSLVKSIPVGAVRLARRFWPGPLTMVLEKSSVIPDETSAGLPTVGIRMPSHPVVRSIILQSSLALAAPSANRSGAPSTTTAEHCIEDLDGRVDAIVRSGPSSVGVESTVISLAQTPPRLLRPGAVTLEMLREELGEVAVDEAVTGPIDSVSRASAPGMKYRHYAPKARVQLVRGDVEAFTWYVNAHAAPGAAALCFIGEDKGLRLPAVLLGKGPEDAAHSLFAALRDFDRKGVQTGYVHCPDTGGMGLAVYNRLQRAAAFDVVDV